MKYEGIVIKLVKHKAIVTTDDFHCYYIKRTPTIYVGKQVEFTQSDIIRKTSIQKKLLLSAACMLFVVTVFLNLAGIININGILSGPKVFAYVDVDINPSLEIRIDESGNVLSLVPLNEDAKILTKKIKLSNISLSKAVDNIIDETKKDTTLSTVEKDYILVSSTLNHNKNKTGNEYNLKKEKLDTIMNSLKESIKDKGKVNSYLLQTNLQERKYARNIGLSTGRYLLYNEYKNFKSDFSIEEARSANVNELLKCVLYQKTEDGPVDTSSNSTPSPLKSTDSKASVTPSATIMLTPSATPLSITPTQKSTLKPTLKPTPKPKLKPAPKLTLYPIPNHIPNPIPNPVPYPTIKSSPPANINTGSKYMKFESYNYPGQFIQHKIYFGAYISANGIIPDDDVFKIVPGLADPNCISLESKNFPGNYLKHENSKIILKQYDGQANFNDCATFKMVSGLADGSLISFQSYNYPDRYIFHKDMYLQIGEITTDTEKSSATFKGIEVK